MKIDFVPVKQGGQLPKDFSSIPVLIEGAWQETQVAFRARNQARLEQDRNPRVGKQADLNEVLQRRFHEHEWSGFDGKFMKSDSWIRYSFRHAMSMGSDVLDAMRMHKMEGKQNIALIYADEKLLQEIWPKGGQALCSFEKVQTYLDQIVPIIDVPLWLGRMHS